MMTTARSPEGMISTCRTVTVSEVWVEVKAAQPVISESALAASWSSLSGSGSRILNMASMLSRSFPLTGLTCISSSTNTR